MLPKRLTADEAAEIGLSPIMLKAIHIITDAIDKGPLPKKNSVPSEATKYFLKHLEYWCVMTGRRDFFFSDGGGPRGEEHPLPGLPGVAVPQDFRESTALALLTELASNPEALALLGKAIGKASPPPFAHGGARA